MHDDANWAQGKLIKHNRKQRCRMSRKIFREFISISLELTSIQRRRVGSVRARFFVCCTFHLSPFSTCVCGQTIKMCAMFTRCLKADDSNKNQPTGNLLTSQKLYPSSFFMRCKRQIQDCFGHLCSLRVSGSTSDNNLKWTLNFRQIFSFTTFSCFVCQPQSTHRNTAEGRKTLMACFVVGSHAICINFSCFVPVTVRPDGSIIQKRDTMQILSFLI